jgi:hypothetical protein
MVMGVTEHAGVVAELAQFGAAGLIAMMWLSERRSASERERRLEEAHRRLMEQGERLSAVLEVVSENSRAMASVEASQRLLASMVRGLEDERDAA